MLGGILVDAVIQVAIYLLLWAVFSLAIEEIRQVPRSTVTIVLVGFFVSTVSWRYALEVGVPWWLATLAYVPGIAFVVVERRRCRGHRASSWRVATYFALLVLPLVVLTLLFR